MKVMEGLEKKVIKKRDVLEVAVTYLSFSDRTIGEIRTYLKRKEYSEAEIEKAINYLKELQYVDDKGYAQRYIEQEINRGKGSLKIKNQLRKKGIDEQVLAELNEEGYGFSKEDEKKQAWEIAERFYEEVKEDIKIDPDDDFETKREKYKEKQRAQSKLGRRLISKGYPQEIVFSIINNIFE